MRGSGKERRGATYVCIILGGFTGLPGSRGYRQSTGGDELFVPKYFVEVPVGIQGLSKLYLLGWHGDF